MTGLPELYSWDTSRGVAGVTDDKDLALQHVNEILRASPIGTCATLREVVLVLTSPSSYEPTGRTSRAYRVPGGVAWIGGG